ncbi:hypothetical protein G7Y89_g2877 [Cudoniella acicularis]|uniref:Uncharacterized protein n=1 Tax=Cudoniella acicularis TaxID=354080 RepID=A0A8H4W8Y5_9HELO|nr:hypothetical protein G7Y89_g2877 [Cudoniella acicularis]
MEQTFGEVEIEGNTNRGKADSSPSKVYISAPSLSSKVSRTIPEIYFPSTFKVTQPSLYAKDHSPHPFINPSLTAIMSTDPKFDSLHKQLFEEGLKMRRSVVGDE